MVRDKPMRCRFLTLVLYFPFYGLIGPRVV